MFANLAAAYATLTRELSASLVAQHGLTINDYGCLLLLSRAGEEGMRRIDLANELRLSPSGITRLLDRLEDQGLVGKGACKEDARVSYAILTDAGWASSGMPPRGTSRTSSASSPMSSTRTRCGRSPSFSAASATPKGRAAPPRSSPGLGGRCLGRGGSGAAVPPARARSADVCAPLAASEIEEEDARDQRGHRCRQDVADRLQDHPSRVADRGADQAGDDRDRRSRSGRRARSRRTRSSRCRAPAPGCGRRPRSTPLSSTTIDGGDH